MHSRVAGQAGQPGEGQDPYFTGFAAPHAAYLISVATHLCRLPIWLTSLRVFESLAAS